MPAHPPTEVMSGPDDGAQSDDPREVLFRPLTATSLRDALRDLLRDVEATRFPLHIDGADSARASRSRLVDQLTEHLVPRLTELAAPAVVVVAGPTGAGKSTLVNSLVGQEVSAAGVLRPTTREPVLVHHPLDAPLLSHHPVLADARVVAHEAVPRGIALLDAPDLDSVVESNRASAHRLQEAADLWLFVITAARFGDAVPWRALTEAAERGTSVAMVLDRVPKEAMPQVRGALLARMREHGFADAPLFVVPDVGPHSGLLDPGVVASVRRWLGVLAGTDRARTVVRRTLRGSLDALRPWVDELAEAVQAQADAAARLDGTLDEAVTTALAGTLVAMSDGGWTAGAVRARWDALTGAKGALSRVSDRKGRVRGSARDARARAAAVRPLRQDLQAAVVTAARTAARQADDAVRAALAQPWAPAGMHDTLLSSTGGDEARDRAAQQLAVAWSDEALRLAREAVDAAPPVAERVGVEAVAAAAQCAALGVPGADDLIGRLLGDRTLVARVSDELTRALEALVRRERAVADPVLADPDLAADAASRLRLRLAVLKGLT